MIRAVIGTSPQLTKYDQLHTSLKDQIRGTDYQRVHQEYDRLLASLQTQVFSVRNSLAVELKSLEEAQWRRQATCLLLLSTKNNYAR